VQRIVWICTAVLTAVLALSVEARQVGQTVGAPSCKSRSDLVGPCFRIRGRITFFNGNPSFRMWPVGSTRLLELHPSEEPVVPEAVRKYLKQILEGDALFGSFLVCPLSEDRPGEMRIICVELAEDLVLRPR
jgi:hypothetical protein